MRVWWHSCSGWEKALAVLFLLTIPFIQPRLQPDGRGYYAYLRSPLIDHNLRFASDWNDPPRKMVLFCGSCSNEVKQYWNHPANELLIIGLGNKYYANPITKTGHLPNFYTVGPAILWVPFVVPAHLALLTADHFGAHITADGHSWPYITALTLATGLYGFLGLWFSFQIAKKYAGERWAFWATVGIWFGSSLPIYMYLNASWSHAHSAFTVASFLWYWDRNRGARTSKQWFVLGLLGGLMVEVYLANALFLLAPALENIAAYFMEREPFQWRKVVRMNGVFAAGGILAFLPMFISRAIVYGNPLALGGMYASVPWSLRSAAFWPVLFSKEHGLFVWTPIVLLAILGLLGLWRRDSWLAATCLLTALAFYCLIAIYPWWDGTLAYGNRFFISLTPILVLGLAAGMSGATAIWKDAGAAARRFVPVILLLILWNLGLMYQWTTHLAPQRGDVYWDEVLYNQVRVVPGQIVQELLSKFASGHLGHHAS